MLSLAAILLSACNANEDAYRSVSGNSYSQPSDSYYSEDDWGTGYEWAEYYDIQSFEECEDQFGVSDAEDGCNTYVQENMYGGGLDFYGYPCTEDCSGHEAGYYWAEESDIDDIYDCDGYSDSFIEGCWAYVEENY